MTNEEIDKLVEEIKDLEHMFELRQAADARAIALWRAEPGPEHSERPPRDLRLPDHADLCIWLLARLDELEEERRGLVGLNRKLSGDLVALSHQVEGLIEARDALTRIVTGEYGGG